ncbi:hypothetical protein DMP17_24610 [Pseudonocardia sp. TMWB2A]
MGLDVNLVHVENPGTSPRRRRLTVVDSVFDDDDIFRKLCGQARSPTLQRVPPWRDLRLTSNDMPQLIHELDALRTTTGGSATRHLLDAVLVLARRCSDLPGSELHLEAD